MNQVNPKSQANFGTHKWLLLPREVDNSGTVERVESIL